MRPGAAEAYVEGVFELPDALREQLGERIARRRRGARARAAGQRRGPHARVPERPQRDGGDLRDVGGALLSFYGQHEHRKLTLASAQLEILDGFCGPEQAERREAFAAAYARERALREELGGAARARRRA